MPKLTPEQLEVICGWVNVDGAGLNNFHATRLLDHIREVESELARLTAALGKARICIEELVWPTVSGEAARMIYVHRANKWLSTPEAERGREMVERLRKAEAEIVRVRTLLADREGDLKFEYERRTEAEAERDALAAAQDTPTTPPVPDLVREAAKMARYIDEAQHDSSKPYMDTSDLWAAVRAAQDTRTGRTDTERLDWYFSICAQSTGITDRKGLDWAMDKEEKMGIAAMDTEKE